MSDNDHDDRAAGPQPGPVPTAEERHHGAHRRLAEAMNQLAQATSFYEEWPAEDDDGSNFADNARMVLDGIHQALDGFTEVIWARYGRKPS